MLSGSCLQWRVMKIDSLPESLASHCHCSENAGLRRVCSHHGGAARRSAGTLERDAVVDDHSAQASYFAAISGSETL